MFENVKFFVLQSSFYYYAYNVLSLYCCSVWLFTYCVVWLTCKESDTNLSLTKSIVYLKHVTSAADRHMIFPLKIQN